MKVFGKKINLSSLIFTFPLFIAFLCLILTSTTGFVGYRVFKKLFEEQYEDITQQIANTALSYIDGDSILRYAANPVTDAEWDETNKKLDALTLSANLAYIYVTIPDEKYESRIYIYDTVHPEVIKENPKVKVYPLGRINSLKSYDEMRINELRGIMDRGDPAIHFVYNATGGHVTTSVPVLASGGKIVAVLSIVKPMSEIRSFKARYLHTTFILSSGLTVFFLLVFILIVLNMLIKPLVLVTKETSEFAEHKGELTGILERIHGNSEPAILARAVEKMSKDIHRFLDELTKTTAEKERLSTELDVATQIQANMLPRIFPPYSDHPEIELFATMVPAKEVGGDFYDFFMIDDDHFAVVVGDVSGKGVPAALFMVIAKTLLKNGILHNPNPAEVFEHVNNELCEGNDAGLFVTCWVGVLCLSTGELTFCNAGHTPPVSYHDGKISYLTVKPDLMLAGLPNMKYHTHKTVLTRGDRLFVYTDGITEATNEKNELFGEERLLEALAKAQEKSSKEMLSFIKSEIDSFVGSAPQFDDITMLEFSLKH